MFKYRCLRGQFAFNPLAPTEVRAGYLLTTNLITFSSKCAFSHALDRCVVVLNLSKDKLKLFLFIFRTSHSIFSFTHVCMCVRILVLTMTCAGAHM